MSFLQRIAQQFAALFAGMTPSQRATFLAAPAVVIAGFAFLFLSRTSESMTAISWGKAFSTEEVIAAEEALIKAGLVDFKREGQRILVPADKLDRYNAALLEFNAMPSDLGSQMLKQMESYGPFTTDKQRQEMKDAMLLQELRRTLRAVPDLDDARVVIANSGRRSTWNQKSRVTANVTVRPKPGRELSGRLVASIRAAVASMVPDLQPADVTVFDVLNGVTHTGESPDDPFDSRIVHRIKELQKRYEQQIEKDLSYIPGAGVSVNVDLDNLRSSVVRTQNIDKSKIAPIYEGAWTSTDNQQNQPPRGEPVMNSNRPGSVAAAGAPSRTRTYSENDTRTVNGVSFELTEKQLLAAMPKAVQVSVSIPRDYYQQVSTARTAKGEKDATRLDVVAIEQEVLANVQKSVARLIPANSPPEAVTVLSVDRIEAPTPELSLPIMERVRQLVQDWGGSVALAVFAFWALMALRGFAPAPVAVAQGADGTGEPQTAEERLKAASQVSEPGEEAATLSIKPTTRRDFVQTIVRDNPEQSATVISKWIQAVS